MSMQIFICIILLIMYSIYLNYFNPTPYYKRNDDAMSDIEAVNLIASDHNMYVYMIHQEILSSLVEGNLIYGNWVYHSPIMLGIDSRLLTGIDLEEFLKSLNAALFETFTFFNMKSLVETEVGRNYPVGLIIKRNTAIYFKIFYSREEVWWYGSLANDKNFFSNLQILGFPVDNLRTWAQEGVIDKFEGLLMKINGVYSSFIYPKKINEFINNLEASRFIECNVTRANIFRKKYKSDTSVRAKRFKHHSMKLLSRTKVVLDNLSIPFWLSSGTCLGYFRECGIIPYSQDVDIGVFAEDFSYSIISDLRAQNIYLKHWFGELEDSLELSFIDYKSRLKLDIFFFYAEGSTYWNGGTQARTGKKFKYVFDKFDLCWTLFLGMKLRVPCDTETYITANYGPNWTVPIKVWDWKSSPPNVKSNGIWPRNKWPEVIKTW